ncbi:hypothetical protein AABB02_38590 [Streptomyces rimosus]
MPVEFLTDEQAEAYGTFTEVPTRPEPEWFFFLDDDDRDLIALRRSDARNAVQRPVSHDRILRAPATAAPVRHEFAAILDSTKETAQMVVAAELLQSASRGDHPDLVPPAGAHQGDQYSSLTGRTYRSKVARLRS